MARGPKVVDHTGKIVGKFKAIKYIPIRKGYAKWECECIECGEKTTLTPPNFLKGTRKYCKGCVAPVTHINSLYRKYRDSAKKRKLSFKITLQDFENLTKQNCTYCDRPPMQIYKVRRVEKEFIYNGIDRKDNKKGYTLKNCVPSCKFCNFAKARFPEKDFLEWIAYLKGKKIDTTK